MTREEFRRRWIEGHAPFALRFPNLRGYRINIAVDEYQAIEGELSYDGTAELWWDSLEEMRDAFDSPEAEAAVADVNDVHHDSRPHRHAGNGHPRLRKAYLTARKQSLDASITKKRHGALQAEGQKPGSG